MDNSFFAYIQQLELLAFFSGYPLLYATVMLLTGKDHSKTYLKINLALLLPFAYALTGCLYLGLQLKNLYPNYSFDNIRLSIHQPFLFIWGLSSIFFLAPVLRKKIALSLLHSLVFFILLAKDLFLYAIKSTSYKHDVKNAMQIYSYSLILNLAALIFIFFIALLLKKIKKHRG